jgi:site-specific recombinase XerC
VSNLAKWQTLRVLPRLDGERKARVLQFLYETGLIIEERSVFDLLGADLRAAELRGANLRGADLRKSFANGKLIDCRALHAAPFVSLRSIRRLIAP